MSPTDAKRGAKRRKNKRGGGSSCSAVCNTSSGKAGVAQALGAATPASVVSFLTSGSTGNGNMGSTTGLNGEVKANNNNNNVTPQFKEGPVNVDFSGVLQTPFTFGLNQRAPCTAGDRCLLCRCERKDCVVPSDTGISGQNGSTQPANTPSALQLPLWVCSDCRLTVEKEDRRSTLEQSLGSQDFLMHMPVGNGNLAQEAATADRLSAAAPTLPMLPAPDLTTPMPSDTVCSCEACNERREFSAESERESQQLQNHWSEVRYLVRCIYRQTGTPLADDQDQPLEKEREGMKELVDRLCVKDPYQLYQRLEQQAREYVLEMKMRLLKHLSAGSKTAGAPVAVAAAQGPPQAHQFISLLLEEYSALCQAARTISSFLLTLENEHLQKFQVTWELHNKHLFENLVFSEPILHNSLPALVAQLKHGTASHDSYNEDTYQTLLDRYQKLEQEMASVAAEWQECEKRIDDYVDEQLLFKVDGPSLNNQRAEPHKSLVSKSTLKTKQRMLKEDWEFFKQRRFIEEQLPNSKKSSTGDVFTDTMRMLSSRLGIPDCPNCNYRRRCTCDDCSLSHILTCGIMDSPVAEDLHMKLPVQGEPPQDYLTEVHPPSLSSGSSASASNSSSPITIQQHSRLVLPEGDTNTFISDDDEVPSLSSKFGSMYPLNSYEDNGVMAAVYGLHNNVNREGANTTLKAGSSHITSSSSSSEGDEEETNGQADGKHEELSSGKADSPPPSYSHQQVEQVQHACECHVCNQDPGGSPLSPATCPPPSRLHAGSPPAVGHQFFTDTKAPPAHPALHLYPHIHGHLPLHNFSRPLLHPTLYPPSPSLTHKPLSPNHSAAKQPAFGSPLPDHVYPNCFGGTGGAGDWNSSLQCLSLKFENLWDAALMKLPEFLPGDVLGPPLPDVPLPLTSSAVTQADHTSLSTPLPTSSSSSLSSSLSSSSSSSCSSSEAKELKKTGAKKKCLYNFQDAFLETNRVVMATSAATSSVSCTATTVQSSNNPPIHLASKRPNSIDDIFHSLAKEDHRQPATATPRNCSTGLASLPPLSGPALPPAPSSHLPQMGSQPFPEMAAQPPGFVESHQGLCLPPAEPPAASVEGPASAPPSVCSDPDCEGHRCEGNGSYEPQPYDGEDSQDEDSCSEHSSSTSTSTNQKEGKYCDCCYCEFFGHGGPPAAPTSRNYAEMREKLRLRLTKRKEEQPKREEQQPVVERDGGVEDHRRVEDLLQFINSADSKPATSSKAAKRARHKQKKLEEKARLEAEAREREEQQLLEEQRRRQEEEEAALQKELLRLQRLQELQQHRAAKKKKKEKAKENNTPPQNNPQPLKQTAQNVLDHLQNGKSQLLQTLIGLPDRREPKPGPLFQHSSKHSAAKGVCNETNAPDSSVGLQNGVSPIEANGKVKAKQSGKAVTSELAVKRVPEFSKSSEIAKTANGTGPSTTTETKATRIRPADTPASPQNPEPRREEKRNNQCAGGKRQQQPLTQVKEDRTSPPVPNLSPSPVSHTEAQQNSILPGAESPQPKGKAKKGKKKKGDKTSISIDDVFLPKDIDLDSTEMDETEREVEYFKRFCLDSARQTRQRLSINWSNFSLKKATFAAH
ncbi:protein FAM193A isoform X1 [Nothobranchius furzeri]|uniref:Family with sequence similarity 193 member A n=1 Tax=Nothobranchius furzeri TaxID=105023 RepID=A0A1A8UUU0_NOTFU|nr:protein FAM193A isoform X1 [Nothobranchius furzeri]KAF7223505.1 transcript variant X1 [Nothobranchius furzeri]